MIKKQHQLNSEMKIESAGKKRRRKEIFKHEIFILTSTNSVIIQSL